jgi:radical SAM protein with 4Fe4S-binding SPASM domain
MVMYNLDELLSSNVNRDQLQKQLDRQAPAEYLRSIKIKIISNCNLRCEMCRYWRIAKQQLDRGTVISLLDHAAALGSKKVHFSGGEVTLHREHVDFIAHAAGLGMRVNLTSNGIAMDKERAKAWIAAGLRSASFSLDGVNARTHDRIRGVPGAFKKTCRAIQIIKREALRRKTKLKIRVNTVLSQQNFRQLPALTDLAGRLGAIDVIPMPIDGKRVVRPSVPELEFFNKKVAPLALGMRKKHGMPINAERIYPFGRTPAELTMASLGKYAYGHYEANRCFAPWLHTFISHDGQVYACCMTRERMESMGNVKEQNLTEIFQGEKYERFRQQMLVQRLEICGNCDQYLKENRLVDRRLQDQKNKFHPQLVQINS